MMRNVVLWLRVICNVGWISKISSSYSHILVAAKDALMGKN